MEYIEITISPIPYIAALLPFLAIGIMMYGILSGKKQMLVLGIIFTIAAAVLIVAISYVFPNQEEDIREKLSDHYDITLSNSQFRDLKYPSSQPKDTTYYGSIEVNDGPSVEDIKIIKLAVTEDGKVVLLAPDKQQKYVELETSK